ncbi:MAG: sulfatase/phosphatase domain-containing protein, partial [Planctomycetota bacterium]
RDWAKYYDNITRMDGWVAHMLEELEKDGLTEDTIVWFWGDHGRGLIRGKRWIYDSGSHVPLIIRVPAKWRKRVCPEAPEAFGPGTVNDDLVLFVDFGPTMLSLCGVPVPEHMQGQAFLGPQKAPDRRHIYGARDRVDEQYDTIRCVRDKRWKYIRNFLPHLPRSLHVGYMDRMPMMQEMRRLHAQGKLEGPEKQYFEQPKPIEELYDTVQDPHEVHNLAADPKLREHLVRLRAELFRWMEATGDFGVLPECEFDALKRPGDNYARTTAPGVRPVQGGEAVELTCDTPGASIAYQVSGPAPADAGDGIVLHAAKAKLQGEKPRPKKEPTNLSGWRNSKAWVSWSVKIPEAGKLPVHVIWGCGGNANSRYTVEIAGQTLEGRSSPTGGWDTFKVARLGEVEIQKPGTYTVALKPVPKAGIFQMDLQAVVLGGKNVQPLVAPAGPQWRVYAGPVPLAPGHSLLAKACRLGYKDSGTVRYRHGDKPIPPEEAPERTHWREVVDRSGVVPRALALKRLDGTGGKALEAYVEALGDPAGSVRYWAALGIYQGHDRSPVKARTRAEAEPYLARFRKMLEDESTAARVVAAQALTDWGEGEQALPVLVEVLKTCPESSGRLLAMTALHRLGEKARPVLDAVKQAGGGYVGRMRQHLLARLGRK